MHLFAALSSLSCLRVPYIYSNLNFYIMSAPLPSVAGLGFVSGLFDSILGWRQQVINKHAQEEANALNYQMFQEQMAYQTQERLETQEYNSLSNVRKRAEAAGINPYLLVDGSTASNASTPMSAPSPAAMQAATLGSLPSLQDNMSSLFSQLGQSEQIKGQSISNQQQIIELKYRNTEKMISISKQMQDVAKGSKEYDILMQQLHSLQNNNDYLDATLDERKRAPFLANKAVELDNESKRLQNAYQMMLNQYFPKMQEKQLRMLDASIAEAFSAAFANKQAGEFNKVASTKAFEDALNSQALRNGIRLDNEQKQACLDLFNQTFPYARDKAYYEMLQSGKAANTLDFGIFKIGLPQRRNFLDYNPFSIDW